MSINPDDIAGKLARAYAPEAISALVESVRQSVDIKARIAAANSLLDRGYGRSVQPVAREPGARKTLGKLLAEMSDEELLAAAAKARALSRPVIEGEGGGAQNGGPHGAGTARGPHHEKFPSAEIATLLPIALSPTQMDPELAPKGCQPSTFGHDPPAEMYEFDPTE